MGATDYLSASLEGTNIMHLALRDERNLLHTVIFFGAALAEDPGSLRLFIPETGLGRIGHLMRSGQEAAVLMTDVVTYQGLQVKGKLLSIRTATAKEEAVPSATLRRIAAFGYPEKMFRMKQTPMMAVELAIRDIYNQTPGEETGERLAF